MKRNLVKKVTLGLLLGSVLCCGVAQAAEDVANQQKTVNTQVTRDNLDGAYLAAAEIAEGGNATNNTLTITEGADIQVGSAYGACLRSKGIANGNKLIMNGGAMPGEDGVIPKLYGAYVENGPALNNSVEISGGTIGEEAIIYGGYSDGYRPAGEASRDGGGAEAGGEVTGLNGNATGNSVEISGGTIGESVKIYGGYTGGGDANNNSVIISGGTIGEDLNIFGGRTKNGAADNNTITINGDVTLVGVDISAGVAHDSGCKEANNNKVIIGGNAKLDGMNSSDMVDIIGGSTMGTAAEGNAIIIKDNAKLNGVRIIAGASSDAEANNNTVRITGNASLEQTYISVGEGSKGGSNNAIIFGDAEAKEGWTGEITSLRNFDKIKFDYLEWNTEAPAVKIGNAEFKNAVAGTEVSVNAIHTTADKIAAGESMTLVDMAMPWNLDQSDDDGAKYAINTGTINVNKVYLGVATELNDVEGILAVEDSDYTIGDGEGGGAVAAAVRSAPIDAGDGEATHYGPAAKKLTLTFDEELLAENEAQLNPQVLVIGESRAAATSFTNMGSEMVETGLGAMARDEAEPGAAKIYAAVGGNASRFETGSHVKVNGWNGIVAMGKELSPGLNVGAFFETGEGNFRTFNDLPALGSIRGYGEANYNGGGLVLRKDSDKGLYVEGSLRAGVLKNSLSNAVITSAGDLAGYDINTAYYGAHVGIGKLIEQGQGKTLDLYGKYIFTHHEGETFTIDGDTFDFDSVNSHRIRLGLRQNLEKAKGLKLYYGAAYEYEFGGDAENKVVGYDLSTPSLGGSTVIGEIGAHYALGKKWELDVNLRGYAGEREGFSGLVQASYAF